MDFIAFYNTSSGSFKQIMLELTNFSFAAFFSGSKVSYAQQGCNYLINNTGETELFWNIITI